MILRKSSKYSRGIDHIVLPYLGVASHDGMGSQNRAGPDFNIRLNNGERTNFDVIGQNRSLINNCRRVYICQ